MPERSSSHGVNHWAIAAGLVLGLAFGLVASSTRSDLLIGIATGVRPIGTVFVNAIQMVVIPLVAVTVFLGVARLGNLRKLGKLGGYTVGFIWLSYVPAIFLGLFGMKVGLRFSPAVAPPVGAEHTAQELPGIVDFLVGLVPRNPFEAAADGSLLPLIVFTILFAAAAGMLQEEKRAQLLSLADAVSDALIRLVHWILWTAPLGVFGLAAPITAESGWAMLQSLAIFIGTVLVCLAIFTLAVYMPMVRFVGRMSPVRFLEGTVGTQAIGFGTTSSVAALPVMMEEAEDSLGLSEEVYPLVLSLAAPMNKAGSALFQAASVVFLASVYDVPLPPAAMGGVFVAIFLVALTVAPVPSASVVTLAPALDTVGVPMAGLAILFGVDRIPDMFRTTVNVIGHMVWAVVVERLTLGSGGEDYSSSPG